MARRRTTEHREREDAAARTARIVRCYEEWKVIRERPRLPFRMVLAREDRAAFAALIQQPTLCAALPAKVQAALRPRKGRRVSQAVLERYLPLLTKRYFDGGSQGSFTQFLERTLDACATEQEIRHFLGVPRAGLRRTL